MCFFISYGESTEIFGNWRPKAARPLTKIMESSLTCVQKVIEEQHKTVVTKVALSR